MTATSPIEKDNSANRLLRLFQANHGKQQGTLVLSVWAEAFCLPSQLPQTDLAVEVSALLSAADKELQSIKAVLLARGVPEMLVVPYIERGRTALSTTLLPASWNNVTQYFSNDTFLAFQWFAYLLDEDAQSLNPEEVKNLLEEMASLEAELHAAVLSPGLKQFLLSHLKAMQDALRQSSVAGVKPIQRAVRAIQSDCEIDSAQLSAEIQATPDKSTAQKTGAKFMAMWKKAVELSGDVEKMQKGAKALADTAFGVIALIN